MEFRQLGSTDLTVSRLGFGCWAIGGHGYGDVDDKESIKAIRRALDLGVNFFDTADVYGFGHSEEILGRALGPDKNKVIIATKFGVRWNRSGKTVKDCSSKRIREALEASLRRLRVDSITLYQIHWYDGVTPLHELMNTLQECVREGKIRYIGCSNFTMGLIRNLFEENHRLASSQLPYNLLDESSEKTIRYCSKMLGMGVLVYGVLARGLFSGKYEVETEFGENDTRRYDADFSGCRLQENLKFVQVLREVGAKYGRTPSQVAIRSTLDRDDITTAIVGVKKIDQIEENVRGLDWRIEDSDNAMIKSNARKANVN